MSQSDLAVFRRELDAFSARLDARIRELRQTGRFADVDRPLLEQARERADRLSARVVDAEQHGTPWDLLKAEAARDFGALQNELMRLGMRLDGEFMTEQAARSAKAE